MIPPRLGATLNHLRNGPATAREIAHATGASTRQVYRDIETLRARGYVIRSACGVGGGYALR